MGKKGKTLVTEVVDLIIEVVDHFSPNLPEDETGSPKLPAANSSQHQAIPSPLISDETTVAEEPTSETVVAPLTQTISSGR